MDVNQPLGTTNPIETEPAITFDDVLLTSVAATTTNDYSVAFLGTSDGRLIKVVIEGQRHQISIDQSRIAIKAYLFGEVVIQSGHPINKDMVVGKDHLYVMTTRRVSLTSFGFSDHFFFLFHFDPLEYVTQNNLFRFIHDDRFRSL